MPDVERLARDDAIMLALQTFGGNPTALRILVLCAEKPHSAKGATPTGGHIGRVAYHFRVLADGGLIRVKRRQQVRGAVATFYTATPKGRRLLTQLGMGSDGHDASA